MIVMAEIPAHIEERFRRQLPVREGFISWFQKEMSKGAEPMPVHEAARRFAMLHQDLAGNYPNLFTGWPEADLVYRHGAHYRTRSMVPEKAELRTDAIMVTPVRDVTTGDGFLHELSTGREKGRSPEADVLFVYRRCKDCIYDPSEAPELNGYIIVARHDGLPVSDPLYPCPHNRGSKTGDRYLCRALETGIILHPMTVGEMLDHHST